MLGFAQIPLGLYVYGSPKALFVLYAVCAFLFLLAWFVLDYLKNSGWFEHRYGVVPGAPTPIPEMSETHRGHSHDLEHGYRPVGMDENMLQTPKRTRFSKLSWPFNRRSAGRQGDETIGMPYSNPYDTATLDSSRVPSAQSPAIGGLAPGPGRREEIVPPVPPLPTQHEQQYHSLPGEEYQQRYGAPAALKDTVLRDSTTLGPAAGRLPPQQHLDMPEPHVPQLSPGAPTFGIGATPLSSDASNHSHQSYQQPGHLDMPVSPIAGGGYMEGDLGFVPTPSPAGDSPRRPLPLPPHRRDRSNDSVNRLPQAQPPGGVGGGGGQGLAVGGEGVTSEAGAGGRRGGQPNVAVHVELNPDGKSVTVRRMMPEEAERERRERSRARQERALQRELEMERERQSRRSQSGDRNRRHMRQESIDRREHIVMDDSPRDFQSPVTESYSASAVSGQSSTIAQNAGGLLGRIPPDLQTPSNAPSDGPHGAMSPLFGMRPVAQTPVAFSSRHRASVTSAGTGTAENSEAEQEKVKEQRRQRRREERAGTNSDAGGSGLYGPRGPDSQWT
jgi:hypothetical protein